MLNKTQTFVRHPLSNLLQRLRSELALLQEQLDADWSKSNSSPPTSEVRDDRSEGQPVAIGQSDTEPADERELPPPRLRRSQDRVERRQ